MTPRKEEMDLLGTSLLIAFSALLGFNQALVKIVNDGFAPIFQSGLRSLCALAPVLIFALIMRRKLSVTDGSLRWGLLNGMLFTVEFGLLFVALDYTTVARASLFFYVMPVWVSLGAHWLIPGEPLNRNKAIGLSLALLGVAIALYADLGAASENAWIGDFLALIAGVFWAGIALLTRLKLSNVSSEMNLLYQLVVSAVVLLLVAFVSGDTIREPTITIYAIFTFQVLIVVATGFLVWFWILSIYPVSNMASFGLLAPIFGVAFGWYLFDDPLTVGFVIALSLSGVGIFIVNKPT